MPRLEPAAKPGARTFLSAAASGRLSVLSARLFTFNTAADRNVRAPAAVPGCDQAGRCIICEVQAKGERVAPVLLRYCERVGPLYIPYLSLIYPLYIAFRFFGVRECFPGVFVALR
jgi:hypothetical protein